MKNVLSVFTFAIGALFLVAFFSTLKPTTVTAAVGGIGKQDRCSLTASSTLGCQTNGLAALPWSVAAMVTAVPKEHLPRDH
jgi:hypothetical protein